MNNFKKAVLKAQIAEDLAEHIEYMKNSYSSNIEYDTDYIANDNTEDNKWLIDHRLNNIEENKTNLTLCDELLKYLEKW